MPSNLHQSAKIVLAPDAPAWAHKLADGTNVKINAFMAEGTERIAEIVESASARCGEKAGEALRLLVDLFRIETDAMFSLTESLGVSVLAHALPAHIHRIHGMHRAMAENHIELSRVLLVYACDGDEERAEHEAGVLRAAMDAHVNSMALARDALADMDAEIRRRRSN